MVFLGAISSAKKIARVLATRACSCVLIPGGMQLHEGRAALSTGGGAVARKSKADKLNPRLTYCRFHITFQSAVPKFVVNLPITFPNSEVGRELRNKVRKFISKFEL
jgi:hypothetical protein